MHETRVKAEDEIERMLLEHHASQGDTLDRERLRYNLDLAIAATIVEGESTLAAVRSRSRNVHERLIQADLRSLAAQTLLELRS